MDSERELKCLAAVWALRGILTPQGFKDFKLKDGLISWDKEELDELVDYLKAKETPATVKLLSANSRDSLEKRDGGGQFDPERGLFPEFGQARGFAPPNRSRTGYPLVCHAFPGGGWPPSGPPRAQILLNPGIIWPFGPHSQIIRG
jgi:hypothetical protein